jgi:predicted Fe-S protein YdhL (DUF1289 family)
MVDSPCIGICQYNGDSICKGCFRTSEEIQRWTEFNDQQKKKILKTIEKRQQELF